jgi:uncharacterized membrane protein YdjX (TVP38/TMEM64 family)
MHSRGSNKGRSIWFRWVLIGSVLAALAITWATVDVRNLLSDTLEHVQRLGPWGVALFILIYVVAAVLFVPGSILTLGAGAVFGLVRGCIYVSVASTLAATAAFLVSRYAAREWVTSKLRDGSRIDLIDSAVAEQRWKIVLLTRLSPLFPFTLLNYAFGLTRVRLRDYILGSWIGMMPGTVLYVYAGSLAGAGLGTRPESRWGWVLSVLGLAATAILTMLITRTAKRALHARAGLK